MTRPRVLGPLRDDSKPSGKCRTQWLVIGKGVNCLGQTRNPRGGGKNREGAVTITRVSSSNNGPFAAKSAGDLRQL